MEQDTSLRTIFVDECEDLLAEISDGFAVLESDNADTEALNAVFRGVHSIKGGAGSFQMEGVVRFAHTFETALEKIRSGKHTITDDNIGVLLRSSDCLASALDAAFKEIDLDTAFIGQMEELLIETFEIAENDDEEVEFDAVPFSFELGDLDDLGDGDEADSGEPQAARPELADFPVTTPMANDIAQIGTAPAEVAPDDEVDQIPVFSRHLPSEAALAPEVFPAAVAASEAPSPAEKPSVPDATPQESRAVTKPPRSTLRVDAERIDLLINTVGELIINQSTILERFKAIDHKPDDAIGLALDEYRQLTSELQERVLAIRAQPVKSLFQRMSRVVREVSSTGGKSARLNTVGEDTEVDKTLVESLAEPLTHMIRNSVDHGLENPEQRKAQGKDETGVVKLSAYHASGNVVIEIADDGAGLNRDKIREIAIKKGLVPADADLSTSEIDRLLFMPGFSTAEKVSDLSGRGVGMDVVKNALSKLGGSITTTSAQGEGTKFKVAVPLTLAVMDGMIVRVGKEIMVLPISGVVETMKLSDALTKEIGRKQRLVRFRDVFVPIISVVDAMNLPDHLQAESPTKLLVIVKLKDDTLVALELDGVLDRRQLVIKGLETNCGTLTGVSSAAVLGDGKLVLIIDPDAMIQTQTTAVATPFGEDKFAHVG